MTEHCRVRNANLERQRIHLCGRCSWTGGADFDESAPDLSTAGTGTHVQGLDEMDDVSVPKRDECVHEGCSGCQKCISHSLVPCLSGSLFSERAQERDLETDFRRQAPAVDVYIGFCSNLGWDAGQEVPQQRGEAFLSS